MKMAILVGVWVGLTVSLNAWALGGSKPWNGVALDVRSGSTLDREALLWSLRNANTVVLGESPFSAGIQQAEAQLIGDLVLSRGMQDRFQLVWEPWSKQDQSVLDESVRKLVRREMTIDQFIAVTQSGAPSRSYAPVFEVLRELFGHPAGFNLAMRERRAILDGGLASADPTLIPPGFEVCRGTYAERFQARWAGPAELLPNALEAECLSFDLMAYRLSEESRYLLTFLLVESAHGDYFDGVVARLRARSRYKESQVVRFIDASEYRRSDLEKNLATILRDPAYGEIADTVIFVNEPK